MKMIPATEFKAHCLRIIAEVNATGEPVTITRHGKPVGVLTAPADEKKNLKSIIGCMAGQITFADDFDPSEPAVDPAEVHANDMSKWHGL